ncbi:MAG TPA: DUF3536 domain-containing protein, partial [Sphaerochaeta sp.]|nr:DUF3536 domain-containing protein [Sphaerochaeta sp.]
RFISLLEQPTPYDRPFILTGDQGQQITAFFYNAPLAEGISFGHFLRSADQLYERLLAIKEEESPALIQTATDGEIYGHHEPFGDMALAALAKKVETNGEFVLTNYAAYLADHPATERVLLHPGEDRRGTSWSCYHGVSRWYKDCGCHTGGDPKWNQKWRTPLRDGFEALADEIDTIYAQEVKRLLPTVDPTTLLHRFAPVASELETMQEFLAPYSSDEAVQSELASLLLGQLYKHYSFTSCGWFFNDIAGIEPRQNITYALMAISYYQKYASEELLMSLFATLAKAKANRLEDGTGETIAVEELHELSGEAEAAFFFALQHQLPLHKHKELHYGYFSLIECQEVAGVLTLEIENTLSLDRYQATVSEERRVRDLISYRLKIGSKEPIILEQEDIPLRMRDELFQYLEKGFCSMEIKQIAEVVGSIHAYRGLTRNLPYLPMGTLHQELIGATLTALNSLANFARFEKWRTKAPLFDELISFYLRYARLSDRDLLIPILEIFIDRAAQRIAKEGIDEEVLRCVEAFIVLTRSHALAVELRTLQEVLYPYLSGKKTWQGDLELLTALALDLNFAPSLLDAKLVALVQEQRGVL